MLHKGFFAPDQWVVNAIRHTKCYITRLLQKFFRDFIYSSKLQVFQTDTGIKYRFGSYDSNRFGEYVIQDIPFVSANIIFPNLIMGADLLQNRYTLCGRSVLQSPHYRLIEEIVTGTLTADSEYVARSRMGTLDARLPSDIALDSLIQKCQRRQAELFSGKMMSIFVIKIILGGKPAYVIADGKHRAALVAYYNRPESLLLRVISNEYVREPFFSDIYSYTLEMSPEEYSINQDMIKALRNEC